MKNLALSLPTFGFVVGTRAALAFGVALLVADEHDDDLPSTVETRDEIETDDYPRTGDDLDADEPQDDPAQSDDDGADL